MNGTIELHAYMWLSDLFRERHWSNPRSLDVDHPTPGLELLQQLEIPRERVEVMFVNHKAASAADVVIMPGDRVALVPPGVPGPYRVLLGFKNKQPK